MNLVVHLPPASADAKFTSARIAFYHHTKCSASVFKLVNKVPKCCITALINSFCLLVEARPANDLNRSQALRPSRSPDFFRVPLPPINIQLADVQRSLAPNLTWEPNVHSRSPQGGRSGGAWPSQTQRKATQLQLRRPGEQREGKEVSPSVPHGNRERESGGAANARRTYPQASSYSLEFFIKPPRP
jgi:hypothetical protein